jgi:hypothetical protein
VRGDTAMTLRLLTHPRALLGGVGAAASLTAGVSAYLPWYEVAANLSMLETAQSRPVATLPGWAAHPWGWLVPAIGLAATVVAVLHAVDRPVPSTRRLLVSAGLVLGALVALSGVAVPPVSRFDVAGSRLRELAGLADRLPRDVELTFSVRPGVGLWLALAAALVLVAAAAIAKDDV